MALCPAHDDKRPSLSITAQPGGRVLFHCWAGCGAQDVLAAVGLDWSAVMPERVETLARESEQNGRRRYVSRPRPSFNAHDVLAAVAHEALIVAVAASNLAQGMQLSGRDHARLMQCASRLRQAAELANG